MDRLKRLLCFICLAAFLTEQGAASTFDVSTNLDSGAGSLRQALLSAIGTGGANTISWTSGSGGALTLGSDLPGIAAGTILDVSGAPSAVTITGAPNALPLSGAVTFQNTSATRDWTISAPISGTGSLVKAGAGKLVLTGANTYSGGTVLNAGTLNVNADATLGNASGGLTFNGGTLQLATGISTARSVSLSAGGGTLDVNGTNSTLSGVISGAGALSLSDSVGGGQLTLSGANTYSGGTTINGATGLTLQAGAANVLGTGAVVLNSGTGHAALNFSGFNQAIGSLAGDANSTVQLGAAQLTTGSDGTSTTFSGVISDGGAGGSLVKTGAGTFTLTRNNSYTGATTVNGGTLSIDNISELGRGGITLNGGALQTNVSMTISSNIALGASGGTLDTGANNSTFSGILSGSALTKAGAGTLTLSGVNTYTGGTSVNAGTLRVAAENNLGALAGGLSFGGGTLQTAVGLNDARAVTLNSGGGTIDLNGLNSTFSGVFADGSGAGSLTVADSAGGGTLTLTGANTYTGGTALNGGTLSVASDGNLGSAAGALSFNGGTLKTTTGITSARAVTLNASGGTIDTQGQNSTFSGAIGGAGALTSLGNGTLFLTGANSYGGGTVLNAGTINISNEMGLGSGALTFNGAGKLQTLNPLTLANAVVLTANGTIDTMGNNSTLAGVISGAGSLTMISSGTLFLTGANTYSGGTVVSSGAVSINNASALGTGTLTLNGGVLQANAARLTLTNAMTLGASSGTVDTNSFDTVLSGIIGGAGGMTKNGFGTLVLAGANTYTGGTFVNAGVLQLGVNNALNTAGALTVNPNGIFNLATYTQTLGSYSGAGGLQLNLRPAVTNLTVTGNATLTNGTLIIKLTPQVVRAGDTFTPLAYGSHTGQFASIVSPAALSFAPTYNANSLLLTASLVPFANTATTGNQGAVGNGLEPLRANPTGDAATVLGYLYTLDATELRSALDQISPVSLASIRGIGMAASGAQATAIGQRTAAIADGSSRRSRFASYTVDKPSPYPGTLLASAGADVGLLGINGADAAGDSNSPWGFFASGVGITGRLAEATSPSGTQPGYAFNTGGLTAGADYRFDDHWAGGASLGYLRGHASIYAPAAGTVDADSARFGVYGTGFTDDFRASLYLGGAADFYRTRRDISFAGLTRTATATPRGTQLNSSASASYDLVKTSGWGIYSPFAGLNYDRLMVDGFSESGANALNLQVSPQTSQSLQSSIGLRAANSFEGDSYSWKPYLSLGWRHEFKSQSRPIDASFATGGGSPFTVTTGDVARDGTLFGAGFLLLLSKQTSFRLDYNGDFRSHFQENTVNGVLRFKF